LKLHHGTSPRALSHYLANYRSLMSRVFLACE
jgi:hypothetical protein